MAVVSRNKVRDSVLNLSVDLSVVLPVYNERGMLPEMLLRLSQVLSAMNISYEIVFVDDGSSDGSADYLMEAAAHNHHIKSLRLSRNFGKEAALTAGLDYAAGMAVIVMDADLQDPPELIPQMLEAHRNGFDVVTMKRRSRAGESRGKKISAHLYYRLLNRICDIDIPRDTGDFRLMSRKALNALKQLPERNRYMKGLFAWVGMRTQVIEFDRDPRYTGSSKWNFFGLLKLAFDGITSFSVAPLRVATAVGVLAALLGGGFGLGIVLKALLWGDPVGGYPSIIAVMTFLGGVQLLSIGLLGEYVGKTYLESKQRPLYVVSEMVYHGVRPQRIDHATEYPAHASV